MPILRIFLGYLLLYSCQSHLFIYQYLLRCRIRQISLPYWFKLDVVSSSDDENNPCAVPNIGRVHKRHLRRTEKSYWRFGNWCWIWREFVIDLDDWDCPWQICSPSEIWRSDTLPENWLKIIVTKWLHELKPFACLSVSCFLTNRWMISRGMSRITCANSVIFAIEKGGLWQLSLAVLCFQLQIYPFLFTLQNV